MAGDAGYKNAAIAKFWNLDRSSINYGRKVVAARIAVDLADKMPPTASVVSTVHEELIVECASDTAEEIKALVETVMLDAVQTMFPGVRFEVESGICNSWAEK